MKVFCIISDERAYRSKAPAMFSAILQRLGIKGAYVPFVVQPKHIGQALQSLRILNIAGASVAVPYKETVAPHLDVLSEGANIIGAINTIVCKGDQLKGYNTNAIGIMDTLAHAQFEVDGKSAIVFGTGGAARAVVFILNWLRCQTLHVVGRDPRKSDHLVTQLGGRTLTFEALAEKPIGANVVVNATSVSSPKESSQMASILNQLQIHDCELVLDLNYGRPENFWQTLAGVCGARFLDGLLPLAFQARRTLALWTGAQVPPEEFLQALNGDA